MKSKVKRVLSLCLTIVVMATSAGYGPPEEGAVDLPSTAYMEKHAATPSEAVQPDEKATPSEAAPSGAEATPSETERKFVRDEPEEIPEYYKRTSQSGKKFWEFEDRYGNEHYREYGFVQGEAEFPLWYEADQAGMVEDLAASINLEEEYYNLAPYVYESSEPGEEDFEEISKLTAEERVKLEFLNYDGTKYIIWFLDEEYYFYGKSKNDIGFGIGWYSADSNGNIHMVKKILKNYLMKAAATATPKFNLTFTQTNIDDDIYNRIEDKMEDITRVYKRKASLGYELDTDYYNSEAYAQEIDFPETIDDDNSYFLGWSPYLLITNEYVRNKRGLFLIPENLYTDNFSTGQIDSDFAELMPGFPLIETKKNVKIRDYLGLMSNTYKTSSSYATLRFTGIYLPKTRASLVLVNGTNDCYSTFHKTTDSRWDRSNLTEENFTSLFQEDTTYIESICIETFGKTVTLEWGAGDSGSEMLLYGFTEVSSCNLGAGSDGSSEHTKRYKLLGYYSEPEGFGKELVGEYTFNKVDDRYYAYWVPRDAEFDVFYKADDGNLIGQETVKVGEACKNIPDAPVKSGYQFIGWEAGPDENTSTGRIIRDTTLTPKYEEIPVNKYQLTLNGNEGAIDGLEIQEYPVDELSNIDNILLAGKNGASRNYYTFSGWYTAAIGGSRYSDTGNMMPANNLTLYAHWSRSSSLVIFYDWEGNVIGSQVIGIGESATPPAAPERPGYTFIGWSTDISAVEDHTNVEPIYKINGYQLILDGNGGNIGTEAQKEQEFDYNESFDQALVDGRDQAVRPYYTFDGWYSSPTGGTKYSYTGNTMPDSNVTVYAHWVRSSSEVIYKDWDGREIDKQDVVIGGDAIPPADPARDEYTFIGWDKLSTNIQADTIITAQYSKNGYTLILDGNGGMIGGSFSTNQVYTYGESFDQVLSDGAAEVTRKYYTFDGWYTAPIGGSQYADSGNKMPAKDVTIYAHWVRSSNEVIYQDWDGREIDTQEVTIGGNASPPADPTRLGYTFIGWDKPSTNIQADTTITAQYIKNSYTLTLDGNGGMIDGSTIEEHDITYGNSFDQILIDGRNKISRPGHTFEGWYSAPIGGNHYSYSGNMMLPNDLIVYALWNAESDPTEPEPSKPDSSNEEKIITVPVPPNIDSKTMPTVPDTGGNFVVNTDNPYNVTYTKPDGSIARDEWVGDGEDWYHVDLDGKLNYDWYLEGEKTWYKLNKEPGDKFGAALSGWNYEPMDDKRYFFDPSTTKMLTGWQFIDHKWYYFTKQNEAQTYFGSNPDGWTYDPTKPGKPYGSMYQNEKTPDGYLVGQDGSLLQQGDK